ncbi:salivary plasminogen activator alpha 1-like [Vanessa tameamea]|uniref:Salivary plasminogen activator alpha 1-like n=1 Tax=Vanessa tameamea TaxID=334116 RepID=A0A8B8IAQ1_VANTA|nr:salivary plasminogen activator alpha 1-like [Vanessa tameamea]
MLRIVAICYLFAVASALLEGDEALQDVFEQVAEDNYSPSQMNCSNIEGSGKGCYECYVCSDAEVQRQRNRGKAKIEFQLHDNKCSKTDICCFSQLQNIFRSGGANCGNSNPEGYPRRVRDALKSVLPGEYPWRAWVHSKSNPNVPLCAAVFISEESRALMTSAYCIEQYPEDTMVVRFSKDHYYPYDVKKVYIHKYFDSETRYNDIAILGLKYDDSLPSWVKPVCRSETKGLFATSCVAVSSEDYYVNTVIPQQSKCVEGNIPLDNSFICTIGARNDYEPEVGGGLICPEEAVKSIYYMAYGITLYRSGTTSIMVHTNVTHFHGWIQDQIDKLLELSK